MCPESLGISPWALSAQKKPVTGSAHDDTDTFCRRCHECRRKTGFAPGPGPLAAGRAPSGTAYQSDAGMCGCYDWELCFQPCTAAGKDDIIRILQQFQPSRIRWRRGRGQLSFHKDVIAEKVDT